MLLIPEIIAYDDQQAASVAGAEHWPLTTR
jgi:hypothetical protein